VAVVDMAEAQPLATLAQGDSKGPLLEVVTQVKDLT